jgi:hypothetical protein
MKDEQLMTSQDKVRMLLVSAAMQERAQNGVQSRSHALTMTEKDEPEVAPGLWDRRALPNHCKTITDNEVRVMIELFGHDDCYEFASSFMHLIKATPGSSLKDCLEQLSDKGKIELRNRAIRGGHQFESEVRFGAVPACRGYRWIFNLATCYAGSTGRIRPRADVHAMASIGNTP